MHYLDLEYPIKPFIYRGISYSSVYHFQKAMLFSVDDSIRQDIASSNFDNIKNIVDLNVHKIVFSNEKIKLQSLKYGMLVKFSQSFFKEKIILEDESVFDSYEYSFLLSDIQMKLKNNIDLMDKIGKNFFNENNIKTTVINRHHNKIKDFVYIGRGTPFGNTNSSMDVGSISREESIERYKYDFYNKLKYDPMFKLEILKLKGKVLACSCKPLLCHGDIIKDYLDNITDYKKEYIYTEKMIERLNKA